MNNRHKFSEFSVGDTIIFEKKFFSEEFEVFSQLSGDKNPLHWDQEYSAESEFGKPIVPLHMTIAPLSQIAGVYFPGDPSLYLGHELRSILPVFYGDKLTYSAQIVSVNENLLSLGVKVLVVRDAEVVLEAQMRVKSRLHEWINNDHEMLDIRSKPNTALIIGGAGEIGTSFVGNLLERGWNLIVHARGKSEKTDALREQLEAYKKLKNQSIDFLFCDLLQMDSLERFSVELAKRKDIALVVHTASPPIFSNISELVQINYTSLKSIMDATVAGMLCNQRGKIVFVNSVAIERYIPGWEDYSAAKAMTSQLLSSHEKAFGSFGLHHVDILSGLVKTDFSRGVGAEAIAMLPEELADKTLSLVLDQDFHGAAVIEATSQQLGQMGFHEDTPSLKPNSSSVEQAYVDDQQDENIATNTRHIISSVESLVRSHLKLPENTSLSNGGLGITQNWDSLRHIELIMKLEDRFNVKFHSTEIDELMKFDSIVDILTKRQQ